MPHRASERSLLSGPNRDFVVELGERLRTLRTQRGMTRNDVCNAAGITSRYLADLEKGIGNASILVLQQIARALNCPLGDLVGDLTASSPEWLMIRSLLSDRNEADMRRAYSLLRDAFGNPQLHADRKTRIALIGLRGAGKSTLGAMLAEAMDVPFVELSREVERHAGCSVREIHNLYGANAYRRYERRAVDEVLQLFTDVVIATPGGVVSDPGTFNDLLQFCTTIWLTASPEEHMNRVIAQGDMRPMAQNPEAMDDLKRILASRSAFYAKADFTLSTSGMTAAESLKAILNLIARG